MFALNNIIVVRCNLLSFGVNFNKILFNKNIQKRIIFIYNNDIAAARVELWSSSTNAKYAESSSTNYIPCKKQITITITITNSLFRQISCSISLEKKGQF